ncbi:hypothetical protein LQ318_05010 [Aliifodinibius salicampi]|uniref:6-bladed beta-propeller protein n=1 Tax=Fodinibius salicampi TaxID=1920655 RepID=A0ABT3PWP0_9BACT|nr:hypothetical protein [Fodinibius salicampi]MCW9712262.1 hypothetical protein [Fodinibius salicampi]
MNYFTARKLMKTLQLVCLEYPKYLLLLIVCVGLSINPLQAQDYWRFSNVQYDGEYFYAVADDHYQVVKLDKDGNVLASFGQKGRGPGEFLTDGLDLALIDTALYVLDNRALHITTLDKTTFLSIERKKLKKSASHIINYSGIPYGFVMDFEETNPFETGVMIEAFRPVDKLEDPGASLFNIRDESPMNPFYDSEAIYASGDFILITREGINRFVLFNGDSLYKRRIPGVEELALGREITKNTNSLERPIAKIFWKEKIMPEYILITSAYLEDHMLYVQVHSYKLGDVLISYNIQTDRFRERGALSNGELLAVDGDTVYTMDGTDIQTTLLSDIGSCRDEMVSFYFGQGVFEEDCTRCQESLLKWYDYARENNIPIQLVLEDDSWFGAKEVNAQTLGNIKAWDLWGAVSYKKGCDDCFETSISARISSDHKTSEFYSLPAPLPSFKEELQCMQE